ncbi:hypothetical protein [Curtobacterium sp. PhB115]|nr:hypothetical protein [Curtobacterium sp. PhB115]ROP75000.1 hypothetical protein EDF19_1089 [Curtobacterium sp. PhB115]
MHEQRGHGRARANPWWATLLVYALGGVLALVAGRMLPWQKDDGS